jgi:glycosyltransferase involved in cell wall biosynthesis
MRARAKQCKTKAMAVVLQVVPALDAGGVERTTIEVAAALVRAGHRALVAARGGRLAGELEAVGGELVLLPMDAKDPLTIWRNARRLAELARDRNVSLLHARSRAPAWSALWAARRLGLPFVTTYHGIYKSGFAGKRLYNSVMARGDIVIANSFYTRAHVIAEHRLDPARVVAIPRGVDLDQFDPARVSPERVASLRSAWGLGAQSGLIVLLPARLTRWKGQKLAVEAFAQVARASAGGLTLILAGDSQGRHGYVEELMHTIAQHELTDRVRLVGHVADMPAAIAAADVILTPSLAPEAFGRVAAEAQAMARPVVAADCGGFAETIIAGETGLLTPPGDRDALAAAIEDMMAMGPEGRAEMGAKGRARAQRLYAASALQEATLRIYDQLLGDSR